MYCGSAESKEQHPLRVLYLFMAVCWYAETVRLFFQDLRCVQPVFTHEFFSSFEITGLDSGYDLFMLVDQFIHISDLAEVDVFYSGSVAAQRNGTL